MVGYGAVGAVGGDQLNKLSAVIFICQLLAYPLQKGRQCESSASTEYLAW